MANHILSTRFRGIRNGDFCAALPRIYNLNRFVICARTPTPRRDISFGCAFADRPVLIVFCVGDSVDRMLFRARVKRDIAIGIVGQLVRAEIHDFGREQLVAGHYRLSRLGLFLHRGLVRSGGLLGLGGFLFRGGFFLHPLFGIGFLGYLLLRGNPPPDGILVKGGVGLGGRVDELSVLSFFAGVGLVREHGHVQEREHQQHRKQDRQELALGGVPRIHEPRDAPHTPHQPSTSSPTTAFLAALNTGFAPDI